VEIREGQCGSANAKSAGKRTVVSSVRCPKNPADRSAIGVRRGFTNRLVLVGLLIVCTFLYLVTGTTLFSPTHWHLAAAANSLEFQDGNFDLHIERARTSSRDLEALHDYWLVKLKQSILSEDEKYSATDILLQAREAQSREKNGDIDIGALGSYTLSRLRSNDDRILSIQIREELYNPKQRSHPIVRNELAYLRSLAGYELDLALDDINAAIADAPDNDAFHDTRAWVLYQMGRPLDALEDAEFAVEQLSARRRENQSWWGRLSSRLGTWLVAPVVSETAGQETDGEPGESGDEGDLLGIADVGVDTWQEAVLRYHRMRILESLGRDEAAQKDRDWIQAKRLPVDDRLN
jgi:tetratricopeptide (TPR) repeat protein